MDQNNPLVSIIVITYNSVKYVVETLNSAINQTYRNIEIIISDDCSTDNTAVVCREWISWQKENDIRIELITTEKNTGTAGNCNRGLKASNGEWIKVIAGDDVLTVNAIEDYVNYVDCHPDVKHLVANISKFTGTESGCFLKTSLSTYMFRPEITAEMQYQVIGKMFFGSGPAYFINATALNAIGGYDEKYPLQEDYPLFIKMIGAGYKMEYLDKVTVLYRVNQSSVSHYKEDDSIFTRNAVRMIMEYRYKYRIKALSPLWRCFHYYSLALQTAIVRLGNNKKYPLCLFVKALYSLTDPFVAFARIQKYKEHKFKSKNRYRRLV